MTEEEYQREQEEAERLTRQINEVIDRINRTTKAMLVRECYNLPSIPGEWEVGPETVELADEHQKLLHMAIEQNKFYD